MKSKAIICAAAVSLVASGVTASTLFGPKGSFSSRLSRLEYDPSTGCSKPRGPYDDDRYAWDRYKADAGVYVGCMQAAAKADMDYASEVIVEGYKEKLDEFTSEVKRGY